LKQGLIVTVVACLLEPCVVHNQVMGARPFFDSVPPHMQGMAVREGALIARGAVVLFMDADGATRVSDMQQLEEALAAIGTPAFGRTHINGPPGGLRGRSGSQGAGSRGVLQGEQK
jgi:hypothetical protein